MDENHEQINPPTVRVDIDNDSNSIPVLILTLISPFAQGLAYPLGCQQFTREQEEIIKNRVKSWVRRVLVELEICPFTKSDTRSGQGLSDLGVPVAKIAYHSSAASAAFGIPALMVDTWQSILDMLRAGPSGKDGVSSILLAAPGYDENFPLWAGPVFAMLEARMYNRCCMLPSTIRYS